MDAIIAFLHLIFDNTWFRLIGGLLALNVVSGIAAAMTVKTFALGGLSDWLRTRAIPYVLADGGMQVFFLVALGGDNPNQNVLTQSGLSTALGDLVHLFVIGSLVAHILTNLKDMGMTAIPTVLTNGRYPIVPDTSRAGLPAVPRAADYTPPTGRRG